MEREECTGGRLEGETPDIAGNVVSILLWRGWNAHPSPCNRDWSERMAPCDEKGECVSEEWEGGGATPPSRTTFYVKIVQLNGNGPIERK
jgi:hypothetical protein